MSKNRMQEAANLQVVTIIARSPVVLQSGGAGVDLRVSSKIVCTRMCASYFVVCEEVSHPIGLLMLLVIKQCKTAIVQHRSRIGTVW